MTALPFLVVLVTVSYGGTVSVSQPVTPAVCAQARALALTGRTLAAEREDAVARLRGWLSGRESFAVSSWPSSPYALPPTCEQPGGCPFPPQPPPGAIKVAECVE